MSFIVAAISNGGDAPEQAYRKMEDAGSSGRRSAEMFKLEVPSLMVGTLDSLMNLSDDLGKTDNIVEQIVRKIEKTGLDLAASSGKKLELTIGGVPSTRYVQQFAWDYAKYPNRRPLKELVSLIGGGVAAMDEELKQLGNSYADKMAALNDAQRRKGGNMMVADLNDVLTEDVMRNVTIHDTEYLKTVFVAIPNQAKEAFEENVEFLGADLVGFGGPDWSRSPQQLGTAVKYGSLVDRHRKRGSPIVPGSAQMVKEDDDSCLYAVTILKSQYEAGYYEGDEFIAGTTIDFEAKFEQECRDKRFVLRPFSYDPSAANSSAMRMEQLQVETDSMRSGLMRWCKTHFGEAYVAWMHIKVIRVFVESVLRYGLPVDFTAVLYKVDYGRDIELTSALDKALGSSTEIANTEKEADEEEYHDFVYMKFDM